MLFPTTDFAVFFVVVFIGAWTLEPAPRRRKAFLVAASYVFYGWWDWRFVFLLAASTVVNQCGAVFVARSCPSGRRRRMIATLAVDLGLLGWFKYYGFLALNVDGATHRLLGDAPLPLLAVTLPVGISFFTFMGMSYVIDVYRGILAPAGWLDAATFISFFPHLVAGPIVRGSELLPQLRERPARIDLVSATTLILRGLAKKVVVSSYLSSAIVDPVFAAPAAHSRWEVLLAIYGYAVQIYADFSGYTDIAIGVAAFLGVSFPDNFDRPYAAGSLQDFWRRWHMTLSRWLRDYLYVPLGGSRRSSRRTYVNILLTMVLGGLWHGAAWTFVAWGALHGAAQVVGRWRRSRPGARRDGSAHPVLARLATFHIVCLGWVLFRATSLGNAGAVLGRLVTGTGPSPLVRPAVVLLIAAAIGVQQLPSAWAGRFRTALSAPAPVVIGLAAGACLFLVTVLGPPGVAPFIYFRF
jgi:alginate O-acetyltransferase complex protein AlgI